MTTLTSSGSAAEAPRPGPGSTAGRRGGLGERIRARARHRRAGRPRWESPAFWALLAVTAVLYLYGLGSSGYANSFYSAAAQAGGTSWKAFLFGSLDAGNAITVDKPPAALWPMGLSVRLFGLGAWQILVPQALLGVASVGLLYSAVRRRTGPASGLLAGALLALTPVAALMFRFNNPDALLCLLMVAALWCMGRAVEDGRTRWLVLAGACFGAGFLAKALQAWLILPVAALVYLVCGPTRLRNRIGQLLCGGLTTLVTAGWWVALVELWPASSRPYIGGSQENSFLELTFGYNGFGRLTGDETGSVGGGGGGGGRGGGAWGQTGLGRLFTDTAGGQISWLLPAALLFLVVGLVLAGRAARTDPLRASFLLWGGSLLSTAATFSFMSGIFHDYYTVALAPYLAAVVAMGAAALWREPSRPLRNAVLAAAVAGTAGWAFVLLGRAADWFPWLRWAVLAAGAAAACGLLAAAVLPRALGAAVAALGLLAAVAGPVAYTVSTVGTPHTGSIVTAGPAVSRGGPPGMRGGGKGMPGPGMERPAPGAGQGQGQGGQGQGSGPGRGQAPGQGQGSPGGGKGQRQGASAGPGVPPGPGGPGQGAGQGAGQGPGRGGGKGGGRGGPGGRMGGLLDGSRVSAKAAALLRADAGSYTWAAAAVGSQNAASYQLSTELPVMAIGGFNGTDPSPTLAQFKKYVEQGRIHYLIAGSRGGPGGDRGTSAQISSWVAEKYTEVKAGDATFYDLTRPKEAAAE
ncbi:ArnT family glycosyltransferase [Streptomyces qinglanensis]|uniref:4-amino-4-deoxy-L-arabinose transferase n=1 Tax=Streptomyces qinglanensis TaxID=943816 RepID=A0A1H9R773_9ACTN|nr:glycosyltransferase family 39 protein [Streptomyces qinglanensis]SER68540.1 4-amino-4-deoxy-L-arabinose transferase [Streptomyces qinglanensis]